MTRTILEAMADPKVIRRKWTERDDKYLIDQYLHLGIKVLSMKLGRSDAAIHQRLNVLRNLGMKVPRKKKLTSRSFNPLTQRKSVRGIVERAKYRSSLISQIDIKIDALHEYRKAVLKVEELKKNGKFLL